MAVRVARLRRDMISTPMPEASELTEWRGFISIGELDLDCRERTRAQDGDPGRWLPVRLLQLSKGRIDMDAIADRTNDWLGFLVLDGLMLVELEEGCGHAGWLVGENDLLRPWEMQEISLLGGASWRVLRPAQLALLDDEFSRHVDRIPEVTQALLSRTTRTAHWLLAKALIASCPLVEDRLILLFALLGERWGKVTSEGILLDLPLSHAVLASLCGARRPSITVALQTLKKENLLTRAPGKGWLLQRIDARDVDRHPSSWHSYADTLGLA